MPNTKEQIADIIGRLESIETKLDIRPKTKGWLAKTWEWTKTHKTTVIPLTALILIIPGWFVSGWFKYYLDHKDDPFNKAVDARIDTKLSTANGRLDGFDRRLATIEGKLDVLILQRAEIVVQKYSKVPPRELKSHSEELKQTKEALAQSSQASPGYWPVSFQVISLLSKATSPVEPKHAMLDLSDAHGTGGEIIKYPPGSVLSLHKVIEDVTFRDAIIYLDSNVVLRSVTTVRRIFILLLSAVTAGGAIWRRCKPGICSSKSFGKFARNSIFC